MYVLRSVAGVAITGCAGERQAGMAAGAGHYDMQANQGKGSEVVIEAHQRTPGITAVALLAVTAGSASMHIVEAMTGAALLAEFLLVHIACVAAMAVQFTVRAVKREVSVA